MVVMELIAAPSQNGFLIMSKCIYVFAGLCCFSISSFAQPLFWQKPIPIFSQQQNSLRGYAGVNSEMDEGEKYIEILRTIRCKSANGKDSYSDFEITITEASNRKRYIHLNGAFVDEGFFHPMASMEISRRKKIDGVRLSLRNNFSLVRLDTFQESGEWSQYRKSETCFPKSQNWCLIRVPKVEHYHYSFEGCREG